MRVYDICAHPSIPVLRTLNFGLYTLSRGSRKTNFLKKIGPG